MIAQLTLYGRRRPTWPLFMDKVGAGILDAASRPQARSLVMVSTPEEIEKQQKEATS